MSNLEEAKLRAKRGYELLLDRIPEALELIELDELDLAKDSYCVLGQIAGRKGLVTDEDLYAESSYAAGRECLFGTDDPSGQATEHGFEVDPDVSPGCDCDACSSIGDPDGVTYDDLQAAWLELLGYWT